MKVHSSKIARQITTRMVLYCILEKDRLNTLASSPGAFIRQNQWYNDNDNGQTGSNGITDTKGQYF